MPRIHLPRSPLTYGLSVAAVLSIVGAFLALRTSSGSAASSTTRTVAVTKGVVQSTASGTGNLAPAKEVSLNFGTSGTVTKVYVKEGEHVSQGQLIARVGSASQKVALAQAKADLVSAEDAQDSGSSTTSTASATSADTATTTSAVLTGDSADTTATAARLVTVADRTDDSAVATQTAETTSTTPASTTPAATTPTTNSGTATTTTPSTGNATSGSGTTSSGATSSGSGAASGGSAAGGSASGGSSGGSSSGGSSGGTTSTDSTASLAAKVASAKLAVEEAQDALDDTELRAPVAGTIVTLSGSVGDSVSAGSSSSSTASSASSSDSAAGGAGGATTSSTTSSSSSGFATLQQLSKLSMSVSFSESDIGKVKVGQAATVTVSAADDAKLAARVTKVGLVATTSNSVVSYPVELTVTQKSAGVLAGMSATAEIVVEQATGVITVPTQALSGRSVTVVKDGEKTTRSVTTGIAGDSTTQIVSGLTAGEVIALPTLSTTSSTAASTSTTSRRSGATGLAGGTAGGFGGGTGGGFPGGGTGGPPTR